MLKLTASKTFTRVNASEDDVVLFDAASKEMIDTLNKNGFNTKEHGVHGFFRGYLFKWEDTSEASLRKAVREAGFKPVAKNFPGKSYKGSLEYEANKRLRSGNKISVMITIMPKEPEALIEFVSH